MYSYLPESWPRGVPSPIRAEVNPYPSYVHGGSDYMSRPEFGFPYLPAPLDVGGEGAGGGYGGLGQSPAASGAAVGFGLTGLLIAAPLIGAGIGALATKFGIETDGSERDKMMTGAIAGAVVGGMAIFLLGAFSGAGGMFAQALRPSETEAT